MYRFLPLIVFSLFLMALPAHAQVPLAGSPAPGFSLISVTGDRITLSELKGKVLLIGMFHICVPCMNQAMEFNKVRMQLDSDKLVILGINTSGDSKEKVLNYLNAFPEKVKFSYLLDPGQSFNKAYIQRDMPTVLIIDSAGVIRARTPGVGAEQLVSFIRKLL
ncbi:MAG: TlpA family protein disulfide reductase [Nitrospinae bacterium]|nr:TlpA family protein disulfide reductase [Nitrospinota bacterium]